MYIIVISPSKTTVTEPGIVTELFEHGLQTLFAQAVDVDKRNAGVY